jgi:hypothetical protein
MLEREDPEAEKLRPDIETLQEWANEPSGVESAASEGSA